MLRPHYNNKFNTELVLHKIISRLLVNFGSFRFNFGTFEFIFGTKADIIPVLVLPEMFLSYPEINYLVENVLVFNCRLNPTRQK